MADSEEVTQWLTGPGRGDPQAVAVIWQPYFSRLVYFARPKLEDVPWRAADEEDVALSAMHSFCGAMRRGRLEQVRDRLGCVRRTVERKLERVRDKWLRLGLGPPG